MFGALLIESVRRIKAWNSQVACVLLLPKHAPRQGGTSRCSRRKDRWLFGNITKVKRRHEWGHRFDLV